MANEKRRLTDIDALIESTKKFAVNFYVSWTQERVLAWINGAPTVDAVEVVRCKDCKHRDGNICNFYSEWPDQYSTGHTTYMEPDDFCSYGEKREVE